MTKMIDIVHIDSECWHFEANVKKCAVAILSQVGKVLGGWVRSGGSPLVLDSYGYLRKNLVVLGHRMKILTH